MNVGFIGLGQMGKPMATRLLEVGHQLIVFNRTRSAAADLEARGVRVATTPAELKGVDLVVTMVADDAAVRSIWLDSNLASAWPQHTMHVNMSTTGLEIAKQLAAAHAQSGSLYASAPVFGRPVIAARGDLDVIAAGPADTLARCEPVFKAMAKQVFVVGEDPARANAVKIARNFLLANMVEGLGESFALVRKAGVDPNAFLNILSSTSLGSPAYRSYGKMIVERAYVPPGFTLALALKDMQLTLSTGAALGVPMPGAALAAEQARKAIASGLGEQDWGALAEYIAKQAGL